MIILKIFITIFGLISLGFIWWYFFGKKEEEVSGKDRVSIVVDGGYKPGRIKIKKGVNLELIFTRIDPNSCLEEVVIPEFRIRKYLPLKEPVSISIYPTKKGIYRIQCGMNMFHGKIIVE